MNAKQFSGTPPAVLLEGVHKWYPKTGNYRDILRFWKRQRIEALRGVDLTVRSGSAFGLLGTNGAGKTTLLKLLAGLLLPNSGKVFIDGVDATQDFGRIRHRLTYVSSDERTHYWRLTGRQNLEFYGRMYHVPARRLKSRVNELLELVGISAMADEMVIKYSSGMRQRLALARGLIAEPRIMLLDEPTRSLDPVGARHIWAFIKEELIGKQGVTVLIATHDMEEATFLCDEVAVVHQGQVKVSATPDQLRDRLGGEHLVKLKLLKLPEDVLLEVNSMPGVTNLVIHSPNGRPYFDLDVGLDDPETVLPGVVEHLTNKGCGVVEAVRHRAGLGDVLAAIAEGRL